MSATPAPHVPAFFVKAGGGASFSDECVKLLAEKGYSPEDFGDHKQVQERIKAAKTKCAAYDRAVKAQGKGVSGPLPETPSAKDRMLAQCQSGHLTQDAFFHAPGERGNACANNNPEEGQGDGRAYDTNMAPCMPMITHGGTATRPRNSIGSPHWAVGQNEAAFRDQNKGSAIADGPPDRSTNPPTATPMSAQCQKNAAIAVGDPAGQGDYDAHMKGQIKKTDKTSAAARKKEAERRRQNAAALQQAAAKEEQAKGDKGAGKKGPDTLDGKTAAECIEAFRQKAMEQMRRAAIKKYGTDYQKTKAETRAAQATAKANANAANAKAKAAEDKYNAAKADPSTSKAELGRLNSEKWQAKRDADAANRAKKDADQQMKNLPCLHAQACSIAGVPRDASAADKATAFDAAQQASEPRLTGFVHP